MLDEIILRNTSKFVVFLEHENRHPLTFSFCSTLFFLVYYDFPGIHDEGKIKLNDIK